LDQHIAEHDVLLRFLLPEAGVRGAIVRLTDAWREVLSSHSYPDPIAEVLGHAVGAASVLSALVKLDGSLIIQTQASGDLHTLVANATSQRTVRGLARYRPAVKTGSFERMCGEGKLIITIDSGPSERYQGVVLLEGEHLSNVLEGYFSQSEQLRTRLWLQANSDHAAALLLQELGDSERDDIDEDGWTRAVHLAETLEASELIDFAPAEILYRLFNEEDVSMFPPENVRFSCGCSTERIASVLRSLGEQEVRDIIEEKGLIEAECEFCNRHYKFSATEAIALFADTTSDAIRGDRDTLH